MKKVFLFASLFSLCLVHAQAPTAWTSGETYLAIKRLNTLGSVLYIAAHPDDENTRLITYLSKEKGYRTGYLSLTRGDGGQNLIGEEQGVDLGLIRTQELLAARRIDGGEQFFTRAFDFGYSKTPAETFSIWNKDSLLADVVWVIRNFQPDVIITRFPTTGEGGHGHHTASAILAKEAFTAAADAKKFPEQLRWVKPWQAKRILWNTFNFGGGTNTTRADQFKIDVGAYNTVLGKSYGELAAESRSQHKSQGFGVPATRGEALEYFSTLGGDAPVTDLMDGVDLGWSRVGANHLSATVHALIGGFDFLAPQKSIPQLAQLYKNISALPVNNWKKHQLRQLQLILQQASGLWLDAYSTDAYVAQGDSVRINISINNRLGANTILTGVSFVRFDSSVNQYLPANRNLAFSKTVFVSDSTPVTQPYWLEHKMSNGFYTIKDQQLIGRPDVQPAFTAVIHLRVEDIDLTFEQPVRYRYTDPVRGELYQPFIVQPRMLVNMQPPLVLLPNGEQTKKEITVTVKPTTALKSRNLRAEIRVEKEVYTVTDSIGAARNVPKDFSLLVTPPKSTVNATTVVRAEGEPLTGYLANASIRHDHIPAINYFYADAVNMLRLHLKTKGKRIGYITGAGDKVPAALQSMGYDVVMLSQADVARNNLKQYDAIITGVRAYNTADWLQGMHSKLMNYVHDGGNLIVQYNTNNGVGPLRSRIGPYPFNINRNRVTMETTPVTVLQPQHPAFNFPNKITSSDFEGWIQERSIYHAADVDKAYTQLLGMADAGETSDNNSLITTQYGRGWFTYTGVVFFRQLPAGVPGAYRLLANLIALNQKKEM